MAVRRLAAEGSAPAKGNGSCDYPAHLILKFKILK